MAKGQMRGNKEKKKPKQDKNATKPAALRRRHSPTCEPEPAQRESVR